MSQRAEMNFSEVIKRIIMTYEENPHQEISITEIARNYNVEKRRLYDLFNVLCAVGICTRNSAHCIEWVGMHAVRDYITEQYEAIESQAMDHDMMALFNQKDSPPIGTLSITTLLIYCYFGQKELTLKQVCFVMAQKRSKMSKLLRRLYLAAFFLEQIGLIAHSSRTGAYSISLDPLDTACKSLTNLKARGAFDNASVIGQLSRVEKSYVIQLQASRLASLQARMVACRIVDAAFIPEMPTHNYMPMLHPVLV